MWTGASGRHLACCFSGVAGRRYRGLQLLAGDFTEWVVLPIEQHSFAVFLEHGSVDPAVPVKISELGMPQMRVQIGDVGQEFGIAPMAAGRRFIGIEFCGAYVVFRGEMLLLLWIHQFAVGFVIPPHVPEIAVQDVGAGVNVTDHALARWHPKFKLVLNRMSRLVLCESSDRRA